MTTTDQLTFQMAPIDLETLGLSVTVFTGSDGAIVVQLDTSSEMSHRLRVNVNDGHVAMLERMGEGGLVLGDVAVGNAIGATAAADAETVARFSPRQARRPAADSSRRSCLPGQGGRVLVRLRRRPVPDAHHRRAARVSDQR